MVKRIIGGLAVIVFLISFTFCENIAFAGQATEEFVYTEENGSLTLTGYAGSEENLVIPSEIDGKPVQAIGEACFQGMLCLKKVTVPEGVKSIGDYAFECCSALEKVYLPESLIGIGEGAFSGCAQLVMADLQDGVESIGKGAFLFCSSLLFVQMPASLKEIGEFAFADCSSLSKVVFRGNEITALPDRAFLDCSSITRFVIPDSVKSIGKRTFSGCRSVVSMWFPGQVTEVGEYAFEKCEKLASRPLEDDFVPENAYFGCSLIYTEERKPSEDGQEEDPQEGGHNAPENTALSGSEAEDQPEELQTAGSLAGEKSIFREEDYIDYRSISNDEFSDWSEKYIEYSKEQGTAVSIDLMPYIYAYKGETIPHYMGMTSVQNHDPEMLSSAASIFGDDFEDMYLMMDHGLSVELSRGVMMEDLILYSGVYDSQLMAAAGTDEVPTVDQLIASIGNTFTDPIMISTTTDPEVASGFGDTLFVIYASKESMEKLGAVSIDSLLHTMEKEILMNAGATYQILDVGIMEIPGYDFNGNEAVEYRNYVKLKLL